MNISEAPGRHKHDMKGGHPATVSTRIARATYIILRKVILKLKLDRLTFPRQEMMDESDSNHSQTFITMFHRLPPEIVISIVEYLFVPEGPEVPLLICPASAFQVDWKADCKHRRVDKTTSIDSGMDSDNDGEVDGCSQNVCYCLVLGSKDIKVVSQATKMLAEMVNLPGIFDASSDFREVAAKALFKDRGLFSWSGHVHRATWLSLQNTIFTPYIRSLTIKNFSLFNEELIAKGHCDDLALITSLPNLHTLRIAISEQALTHHRKSYSDPTTEFVHGPSGSKRDYAKIFNLEHLKVIKLIKECSSPHPRPCQLGGRWQMVQELRLEFETEFKQRGREAQVTVLDAKYFDIRRDMW